MSIRIAHVSDAHVAPGGRRTATLKDESVALLRALVAQLVEAEVELTLFGGDNVDNRGGGLFEVEAFLEAVAPLSDWAAVPGNHEASKPGEGRLSAAEIAAALGPRALAAGAPGWTRRLGEVEVIGVDTTTSEASSGLLRPEVLAFVQDSLRASPAAHIIVLGHHLLAPAWAPHVLDSWTEEYLVHAAAPLTALLCEDPRVLAYLCGHHHACRLSFVGEEGAGFYQLLTPSVVAYPHGARLLSFEEEGLVLSRLLPPPAVLARGAEAVLGGRKARRYAGLGAERDFLEYLWGRAEDSAVCLPYTPRPLPGQRSVEGLVGGEGQGEARVDDLLGDALAGLAGELREAPARHRAEQAGADLRAADPAG